jgi:hypothetical protein
VFGDGHVVGVEEEWRIGGIGDVAHGEDVVEVRVAGQDAGDADTHVARKSEDLLWLVPRVDDDGFAALTRADDPTILAEQPDDDATHL